MSANMNQNKSYLVTIVSLVFIASAFVFGVLVTGKADVNSTPLISTVLGFVSLGIVSLVALLGQSKTQSKIDETQTQVQEVHENVELMLNGEMEAKIRAILIDVLERQMEADREEREGESGHGTVTKPRYLIEPLDPDQN